MKYVAGVDEVGRGPLAGPVVAAAVVLPEQYRLPGLTDSKKLSEKKRNQLDQLIKEQALAWCVAKASVVEIDTLNILHASLLSMKRAVESLSLVPHLVLVDGNRLPYLSVQAKAIVGGDASDDSIAAASIVAKVYRDELMCKLHDHVGQYGFDRHKGYPTKQHLLALSEYGVSAYHRKSFAPVKRVMAQSKPYQTGSV